ncbi:hypothetical protein Tco_0375147 [Tanacetum coccineum]
MGSITPFVRWIEYYPLPNGAIVFGDKILVRPLSEDAFLGWVVCVWLGNLLPRRRPIMEREPKVELWRMDEDEKWTNVISYFVRPIKCIQVKDIVKEVEDHLKTYSSARMDINWGGSHVTNVPQLDVKDITSWKYRRLANQDKRLKSIIISCLPNNTMKVVIKCANVREMRNDLILSHEGPSETRDTKIAALRLISNSFKALEGEKMAAAAQNTNNTTIRSILLGEKLTGSNFTNWYRNIRIVLRYEKKLKFVEQPIGPTPDPETADPDTIDKYYETVNLEQEVACLMLSSMSPDLQRTLDKYNAYDMMKELKTMFEEQAKQELFEIVKAFHACKQEDGQSVSSYLLKMKSYLDTLERLGYAMPNELGVSLILNCLNKDYDQFVQNYNMHSMRKTISKLLSMLKLHEKGIPKKAKTPAMLAIWEGKIQKDKKKLRGAKGKDKKKTKLAYAPKPKIPPPPKRDNSTKDSICHHCNEYKVTTASVKLLLLVEVKTAQRLRRKTAGIQSIEVLKWDQQVVSELVALRNFLEDMDQDSAHMVAASKVSMLKPGEFELWRMMIEQYIKMIDYALWEVIENAIEKRSGRNKATKKTQRNLLKQQYENFTAPSSEMLDQTFDRLQKLVSQLELLGEKFSQEDVKQKLLRSLSPEWNTHAVVWRNKADLDTTSMDDLYNKLKVYEPEVKGIASSSSSKQNMAFVSFLIINTSSSNKKLLLLWSYYCSTQVNTLTIQILIT